jgi:hypothetical protein
LLALSWRGWIGFAAAGCAPVLACRHDWVAAGVAAFCALPPLAWWFRGELIATKAALRSLGEMETLAASYAVAARLARAKI